MVERKIKATATVVMMLVVKLAMMFCVQLNNANQYTDETVVANGARKLKSVWVASKEHAENRKVLVV